MFEKCVVPATEPKPLNDTGIRTVSLSFVLPAACQPTFSLAVAVCFHTHTVGTICAYQSSFCVLPTISERFQKPAFGEPYSTLALPHTILHLPPHIHTHLDNRPRLIHQGKATAMIHTALSFARHTNAHTHTRLGICVPSPLASRRTAFQSDQQIRFCELETFSTDLWDRHTTATVDWILHLTK